MTGVSRPVLITSLGSAALLDGQGDLELVRETRGAPFDWGGVYAQLVRLTGPWRIGLRVGDEFTHLPTTLIDSEQGPSLWRSHHRWGALEIEQTVAAVADPPGVARTLRISTSETRPVPLTVGSEWSPYLLPPLVEGIRPIAYRADTRGEAIIVRQRGFGLSFRSTVLPTRIYLNRGSWIGGKFEGQIDEFGSEHELSAAPGAPASITLFIHGGLERDLARGVAIPTGESGRPANGSALESDPAAWRAETPTLRFPDAPGIQRAYDLARASLRQLYAAPGDGLVGLVAGYPWYSAIWCRDLAWMLPAVIWMGDFDWVERSLDSVFRFQSRTDLPILGARRGELPMQIAPGPIFLYGTSDTTLYYPSLVDRLVRHSGRADVAPRWFPVLQRIVEWGEGRADPSSGLIQNGGEAGSIGAVKGSVARVRYGIDSNDTTIWDSTDRRDHAIDLQVLWHEALVSGVALLPPGGDGAQTARWTAMASRLEETVRSRYRWPEEQYLVDSIDAQGPVRKVRPNALRVVSAGWLDPEDARSVVRRAARDDLSTPWGVRTLSARDPSYDPQAYHDGQVWTIATAWAADAAFASGEVELGVEYLATIARLIEEEGGGANECYRGDRAEPFNSCFLLGFSIAPFLSVLFDRLWGLRADARRPLLEVRPNFPAAWTSASIERLKVGEGRVDLEWSPRRLAVRWSGPTPLALLTRTGLSSVTGDARQEIELREDPSSETSVR